jgi:hypothetical protein
MAFTAVGNVFVNAYSSSATTVANSTAVTIPAGAFLVAIIAIDNISTTDAITSNVTSVTDSASNTWIKVSEYTNGNGSAGAGATVAAFYSLLTNPISSGFITATLSSAVVGRAITVHRFTPQSTQSVFTVDSLSNFGQDAAQQFPGSMTNSGLPSSNRLWIRAIAGEGYDTLGFTPSSGYTTIAQNTNGFGTSAMAIAGEYSITTSTTSTSNPTLATTTNAPDWASLLFSIREDGAAPLTSQTVTALGGTLTKLVVTGRASESADASGWGTTDFATVPYAGMTASNNNVAILVGVLGAF